MILFLCGYVIGIFVMLVLSLIADYFDHRGQS